MPEFGEKITRGSGTLEFGRAPNGLCFLKISGFFRAMYQIAVGHNGTPLASVPFTGMGSPLPPYPQPSILAWIQADEQGLWGRRCPECKGYFRTNHVYLMTVCPYCAIFSDSLAFITEDQRRYILAFRDAAIKAAKGPEAITIDLGSLTDNKSEWNYSEERQQFHFNCSKCNTQTDILGEYGWCPQCGGTNGREVLSSKLKNLEATLERVDKEISDREQRGNEWEKINNACFSELEALGNHVRSQFLLFPATPKRQKELMKLSFQKLQTARDSLEHWFAIDIFKAISEIDRTFMRLMLNRRHIAVHNAGRVDAEYLEITGDTKARLHERIRLRSAEVRRIIPLINSVAANLLDGQESMNLYKALVT
jgi:hypothetical protein